MLEKIKNKFKLFRRSIKFWWQRRTRGWDDSETWDLSLFMSAPIVVRLKRFKELNNGFPFGLKEKEWDEILDKMIFSFEWHATEYKKYGKYDEKEYEKVQEGLKLFAEWYNDLWW